MKPRGLEDTELSPWWRRSVLVILLVGFVVLGWVSAQSYRAAPPIPARAVGPAGSVLFTREDGEVSP